MKKSLLILLFALVSSAISLSQTTIYVNSVTGNDATGDGTSGAPYKTFHKGYTMALSGDILDLTGTFDWTNADETGDATSSGYTLSKNLTIQGQGIDVTYIQAASTVATADRCIYTISDGYTISFKYLTLRWGNVPSGSYMSGGITALSGAIINMSECKMIENKIGGTGWGIGGAIASTSWNRVKHTFTSCTFKDNQASGSGYVAGAIELHEGKAAIFENCTFDGNQASCTQSSGYALAAGAVFEMYRASAASPPYHYYTNCTFYNNTANRGAGAIFIGPAAGDKDYFTNCSFAENSVTVGGCGGIAAGQIYAGQTVSIYLKNTIIANNTNESINGDDFDPANITLYDNGNNIVEYANGASFSSGTSIMGNQTNLWGTGNSATPALADNSTINGTQTLALSTGSVAINAGDNAANGTVSVPTTDQRGFDRVGSADIGAFEFGVALPNTAPEISSSATVNFEENSTGTVIDVQSTDVDGDTEGSGLTYAFSTNAGGGLDNNLFAIDSDTGVITFLVSPDYEVPSDNDTNNNYEVQVTVTDSGSLTAVQDITITVTDETSEPVIESIVDFDATTGSHNLTSGTRLYHIVFKTPTCTSYDLMQLGANIKATSTSGNVKLGLYNSDRSALLYETSPIAVTGGVDEYVSAAIPLGTLILEKNTYYWVGIIGDAEIWIDATENPVNNGTATGLQTSSYAMYQTNSVAYPVFPVPAITEIAWYRAVSLVVKGAQVPSTIDTSVTLSGATLTANNESASYQWINCSDMSSIGGETSRSFTATASGDYAVIITEGVCSSTSICTTVDAILGIENDRENVFKMYPNPVGNTLHITAEVEIQQVSLFNLIGQKVLEFDVRSKITTIDVSLLPQGVYNVILKSESAIKTVKIVKN